MSAFQVTHLGTGSTSGRAPKFGTAVRRKSQVLQLWVELFMLVASKVITISGWWFGTFFIVPYIWNNHPN